MVYRPPKKTSIPAFPGTRPNADPLEGPLQGGEGSATIQGDDRNLVVVDQDYAGADLDDRAWLFWQKQRGRIIGTVAVVCVAAASWQGWQAYQRHLFSQLQDAYQAADSPAALLAFAQGNSGATLGQLAQLEAADGFYKNSQFKEAADAYAQATAMWGKDEKGQRARLGRALALLQSGDAKSGREQLEAIGGDAAVANNYRGEAGYYLAILALQAGDAATATKWIEQVKALPQPNEWSSQVSSLSDVAPLLADVKAIPGSAVPTTTAVVQTTLPSASAAKKTTPAATPASVPAPLSLPALDLPPLAPLPNLPSPAKK